MLLQLEHRRTSTWLADPNLVVRLDGALVYDGSFAAGFVHRALVAPGEHVVDAVLRCDGAVLNRRRYVVSVDAPADYRGYPTLNARLVYRPLTGNFARALRLRSKRS